MPPAPPRPPVGARPGEVGVRGWLDAPLPESLPPELRIQIVDLRDQVRRGRRRGFWLATGACAAMAVAAAAGLACHAALVLPYAELQGVEIRRDPGDADRLALVYVPLGQGLVGFRRAQAGRETELLDRVGADEPGKAQTFEWRVRGLQAGDVVRVRSRSGWSIREIALKAPELPPREALPGESTGPTLGDGVLVGRVLSAIDKRPLPGATVRLLGAPIRAVTDAEGGFRIRGAPVGSTPIEISADGFSTEQIDVSVAPDGGRPLRVALSPGLERGQMRIVLTWEDKSRDLDAHLEGPLPDDQRFHVYYHQPGDLRSREFVRLDVDSRVDGGPETITVLGVLPGVYHYFVHDYTARDDPASQALPLSGAEVKLYHGGQTYRFRADPSRVGNVWDVCTIEVAPDGALVRAVDAYRGVKIESLGLYAKRTLGNRAAWIADYGGSPISEQAVRDALEWLARHQNADGSWSPGSLGPEPTSRCEKPDFCTGPGDQFEMGLTGLALLAFQAGGHYDFNGAEHSETVRRGLDWIVGHQKSDGALVGTKDKGGYPFPYHKYYMYEHGIAAFALADACAAAAALGRPQHEAYRQAAQRAVEFIEANQLNDGGWRYAPDKKRPGDTSVAGWQVLALKSAKEAGIPVSPGCVEKTRKFFQSRVMGENGRTGYEDRIPQTDATTGVGMLARQFLLEEPDDPLIAEAAEYLADLAEMQWGDHRAEDNADYYLWYNCTLAMFQVGGEPWRRWNDAVRDTLIGLQRHDGCRLGSWDPIDKWGKFGGRVYATALAALTLETYYRYTPQRERGGAFSPGQQRGDGRP